MDLLRDGVNWLTNVFESHASQPIVYHRGEAALAIDATLGSSEYVEETVEPFRVAQRHRDFVFRAALLDFGAGPELPREGDVIAVQQGGVWHRCQVSNRPGEKHYRFEDPDGVLIRVHTQQIG